jgi:hypothetical protein
MLFLSTMAAAVEIECKINSPVIVRQGVNHPVNFAVVKPYAIDPLYSACVVFGYVHMNRQNIVFDTDMLTCEDYNRTRGIISLRGKSELAGLILPDNDLFPALKAAALHFLSGTEMPMKAVLLPQNTYLINLQNIHVVIGTNDG